MDIFIILVYFCIYLKFSVIKIDLGVLLDYIIGISWEWSKN